MLLIIERERERERGGGGDEHGQGETPITSQCDVMDMCVRRGRWRKQVLMSQIRKSEEGVYFFLFQNRLEGRVGQWSDKHHREREIDRRGLIFFSNFSCVCISHIRRHGSHRLRRVLSDS